MCRECWEQYGAPTHTSEAIAAAVGHIQALYALESTGGPLHAVLDDWNIEGDIELWAPHEFVSEVVDHARAIAALFNGMSVVDRAASLAQADGLPRRMDGLLGGKG